MKSWVCLALFAFVSPANAFDGPRLTAAARAEEAALGARIGVAALDTGTGEVWRYRADERFPLDSTHKAFGCAALLAKADRGEVSLETHVAIAPADLVPNSPITEKLIAPKTPTLADMCAAALAVSDNTAANFVLTALGGPGGVTAFFRSLGDAVSRLDRTEPELNEATPGDPSDTTTPAAAVADLDKILLGNALKPASRARLAQWMLEDRVAGAFVAGGVAARLGHRRQDRRRRPRLARHRRRDLASRPRADCVGGLYRRDRGVARCARRRHRPYRRGADPDPRPMTQRRSHARYAYSALPHRPVYRLAGRQAPRCVFRAESGDVLFRRGPRRQARPGARASPTCSTTPGATTAIASAPGGCATPSTRRACR